MKTMANLFLTLLGVLYVVSVTVCGYNTYKQNMKLREENSKLDKQISYVVGIRRGNRESEEETVEE